MNTKSLFKPLAFIVFALAQACSGSSPPDPTSSAALLKATPMKWGTTCVEHRTSSYGTAADYEDTPHCLDQLDCNTMDSSEGYGSFGGAEYQSQDWYSEVKFFEGTCADQHPVTCDNRKPHDDCDTCQYEKCCGYVGLCEDDPNCGAIIDCINGCKTDEACARRCLDHGEYNARQYLTGALQCIDQNCKDRC